MPLLPAAGRSALDAGSSYLHKARFWAGKPAPTRAGSPAVLPAVKAARETERDGSAGPGTLGARLQLRGLRLHRGGFSPLAAAGLDALGFFQPARSPVSPLSDHTGISP